MGRRVDVTELIDAKEVAAMLGFQHYQTVHTFARRHPEMPKPVVDKPAARLWVRADIAKWLAKRETRRG